MGLSSPAVGRAGAGGHPCQGIWHAARGTRPKVGFIATHYSVDFSEHYLADYLAQRGFGFLGWNTRFRGLDHAFILDHAIAEIGVGVRWMREVAGVEKVVLLGNSGGGSLMCAYQSEAVEPGSTTGSAPGSGQRTKPQTSVLSPGDLFVFLAAHRGRPDVLASWLDASVIDEDDPTALDPELDIFNPEHGPPFTADFVSQIRTAQRDRSNRITAWCKQELDFLSSRGIRDRLFVVNRAWADPRFLDATLDPNRRVPGTCYLGDPRRANSGVFGLGQVSSLRTWLSMWSLTESQCRVDQHLGRLHVPTLLVEADADSGVFPSDGDAIFDRIAADDKTRMRRTGDHYFIAPLGARERLSDAIGAWVNGRV